ncbi:hypothetical protein X975_15059, partial [Stegodyphus mimosarum]
MQLDAQKNLITLFCSNSLKKLRKSHSARIFRTA